MKIRKVSDGIRALNSGYIQRPEVLIPDFMSKSDIVMVNGGSKTHKTWFVQQLATAATMGREWLNFNFTRPCKVFFVNGELREDVLFERFDKISQAMGGYENTVEYAADDVEKQQSIKELNLEQLKDELTSPEMIAQNYDIIVIDPFYVFNTADENSAKEMTAAMKIIREIQRKTGASIICTHHHSKGQQSYKAAIDQASGSGVFGRYPDLIINIMGITNKKVSAARPASQISFIKRYWKGTDDIKVFFDYDRCVHELDTKGELDNAVPCDQSGMSLSDKGVLGNKAKVEERVSERELQLVKAYTDLQEEHENVPFEEFVNRVGKTRKTVENWMKNCAYFTKGFDPSNGTPIILMEKDKIG